MRSLAVLDESDVGSLLTEALTRQVQAVFADDGVAGASNAAGAGSLTVATGVTVPNVLVSHVEYRAYGVGYLRHSISEKCSVSPKCLLT